MGLFYFKIQCIQVNVSWTVRAPCTLHRTTFNISTVIFAALCVCRRCQVLRGPVIWRDAWSVQRSFFISAFFRVWTHSHYRLGGHAYQKHYQLKLNFIGDLLFGQTASEPYSQPKRARRSGAPEVQDGPLIGQTCQSQLKPGRVPNSAAINPKVSLCVFYLHLRGCTTLRAMPHSKPTSMPPAECHNSTSEIAWRIQKTQPVTGGGDFS